MTKVPENNSISENLTERKEDGTSDFMNASSADIVSLEERNLSHEERRNYKDSV